jgi:hypothetical protein
MTAADLWAYLALFCAGFLLTEAYIRWRKR